MNQNQNPESKIKLRPYLTVEEIKHILTSLESESDTLSVRIKFQLAQTILKYDAGFVSGSYISSPRKSITEKLGMTLGEDDSAYLTGTMTPEEEEAYLKQLMEGGDFKST